MPSSLAERLVATLPSGMSELFNPWADTCQIDQPWNGPAAKLERLAAHLDCVPEFILCGEAPGYQGCRHAGIAFTSERLLLEGGIPRVSSPGRRLTTRHLPFSEPSATTVWKTLYRLGIADRTVMWNALQMHPHTPDSTHSNRTPTQAELDLGAPSLQLLLSAFPAAKVVAVGKKAEGLLTRMGVTVAATVRHPANGGTPAFCSGMESLVRS